ncbi:XAC0095 family protein [Dyella nitratireducens]|uniref:XAC0095-like domain-containing protein n=1 Tax=Dyella nitratireducens TaxID=1849580 RepID=A0ABQ1G669_9GAMM|nr:hypothetical protein [Dyella nitratireducens]GGA37538.1 hypothetical protein GCM10010981_28360 [Dyella nitratireducens]GLQ41214.1 hypothetical protein GCM10007902_10640 [Dyella nitratireducens]
MEDMHGGRCGPQLYLLSQDGYEDLKHLQNMLTLMARITYNAENAENGKATMTIGRAELYFVFQSINTQLGGVIERVDNENWLGTPSHV